MNQVVQVEKLRKTYGATVAVDEVSFEVREGEIFGMVGPNGAGKTTTIECVEGLRRPERGTVRVLGLDPTRQERALRPLLGVQLQQANLPEHLKVWEALDLYASFYPHPVDWKGLIEQLGLAEKRDAAFHKLSGGQKQRLFIALALVNDPQLVFLDELTTGLDPQARHAIWDLMRDVRQRGKTIVLTTHFMEEAERLCDRVAILDHGRIVALDTPANLIQGLGIESRIVFSVEGGRTPEGLADLPSVTRVENLGDRIVVYGRTNGQNGHAPLVAEVVNALTSRGVRFDDLRTEQPSLEDVFLTLTGQAMRD
ncbi:MAG: multidrug ABC transporter ATP-binding protein [Chloroflexi bacterium HGW-Chloroflexi-1]|nr:MAG: multidrug ABC transporter ATP-binding protein [Chloroflexi bacterium HGW-Chloroflexi-1]